MRISDWSSDVCSSDLLRLDRRFRAVRRLTRPPGRPSMRELSETEFHRYARHLILDEVGEEGQARLLEARVLILGAGGLGAPVSMYLAAAGVGTLVLVDDDTVDLTNLQRQIVHATESVGRAKVAPAVETLSRDRKSTRL